jgi:hypothetical protein
MSCQYDMYDVSSILVKRADNILHLYLRMSIFGCDIFDCRKRTAILSEGHGKSQQGQMVVYTQDGEIRFNFNLYRWGISRCWTRNLLNCPRDKLSGAELSESHPIHSWGSDAAETGITSALGLFDTKCSPADYILDLCTDVSDVVQCCQNQVDI